MSVELEGRANALRKEALQCLTMALCGSDTKKFWELLTMYFRANHTRDEDDPWDFIDPAPEIPRPLPLTETDTDEENKAPSASAVPSASAKTTGSACRKPVLPVKRDDLKDLCNLQEAIRMYPATAETINETGIPLDLQVS